MRRRGRLILLVCGLALLAILFIRLDPAVIFSLVRKMGVNFFGVVAIFLGRETLRATAIRSCLPSGPRPSVLQLIRIRLAGEAVSVVTSSGPLLAEPTRAWLLARQQLPGAVAYGTAIGEFAANWCASLIVTAATLIVTLQTMTLDRPLVVIAYVQVSIAVVVVTLIATAVITRTYVIGAVLTRVRRLPLIGRVVPDPVRVHDMEDVLMTLWRRPPAAVAQLVILELLAQFALIVETWWSIHSMGVAIDIADAFRIEALTKLAGMGVLVGVTEGGNALVLKWLGFPPAVGFTLSLVKRARSLVVGGTGVLLAGRTGVKSTEGRA